MSQASVHVLRPHGLPLSIGARGKTPDVPNIGHSSLFSLEVSKRSFPYLFISLSLACHTTFAGT